jgi:hypothetical protein
MPEPALRSAIAFVSVSEITFRPTADWRSLVSIAITNGVPTTPLDGILTKMSPGRLSVAT